MVRPLDPHLFLTGMRCGPNCPVLISVGRRHVRRGSSRSGRSFWSQVAGFIAIAPHPALAILDRYQRIGAIIAIGAAEADGPAAADAFLADQATLKVETVTLEKAPGLAATVRGLPYL